MGGQQAYYWAIMHSSTSAASKSFPQLTVKPVIAICASARTSGLNYAFLEGPIAALETSFDYPSGQYRASGTHPAQGLRAFGRALCGMAYEPGVVPAGFVAEIRRGELERLVVSTPW
jgi:homoserine acetyltransferase